MAKTSVDYLLSANTWIRLVFMLIFAGLFQLGLMVTWFIVLVQLVFVLFSGKPNQELGVFALQLTDYLLQILHFLTFTSEEKPFPFADWPERSQSTES